MTTDLHPLAHRFADVVAEYEHGRPEYPPAVVGVLAAELGLAAGDSVLDLAAGTGKLTRALVGFGFRVTAVEPLPALRAVLEAQFGTELVREGTAELIPLPDGAVQAVTVGDAFHWFDHAAALAEIARVLGPGGGLAILTTIPDWGGTSWGHELGSEVSRLRPQHPGFDGVPWQQSLARAGGWAPPQEIRVTVERPADPGRIVAHLASMSWMAAMPEGQRRDALAHFERLIAAGETPATLPVHFGIGLTQPSTKMSA